MSVVRGINRSVITSVALNVALVLLIFAIGITSGAGTQTGLLEVFIVAILALSWDVLARAGLVSVGQGAFFGFAVYGAAILLNHGLEVVPAWLLTVCTMLVFCVVLGFITLRIRGVYFSLATLALGLTGQALILMAPNLTGGAEGLPSPMLFDGDLGAQLAILTVALIACVLVSELLLHSRWGTIFFTVRDAPSVAAASGLNVTKWRITALVISGMLAGLAGVLYGGLFGYINGDDVLSPNWSVLAIAAAVIGGADSTIGSLIGAAIIVVASQYLSTAIRPGFDQIIYGILLIAVILLMRGGVIAPLRLIFKRASAWVSPRRKVESAHVGVGVGQRVGHS